MILYRKSPQLRIRRAPFPQPPFWFATAVSPYGPRHEWPVAIEYLDGRATASDRLEVAVCDSVVNELSRSPRLREPLLIDATGTAEEIFRRGDEALAYSTASSGSAMFLTSTRGALPSAAPPATLVTIVTWPPHGAAVEKMFAGAGERGWKWGAAIPVLYPVTTELQAVATVVDAARRHGAIFCGSMSIDLDPTAKHALARQLGLDSNDEAYAMLFHADLEPLLTATERHIAALAHSAGLADFIVPPRWDEKSNWNAAALLTLTATRMIAMAHDLGLAGALARSARVVAELEKPLTRIAEAAALSIIDGVDEVSADILTEWLDSGGSAFVEKINRQWRLRRDAGL